MPQTVIILGAKGRFGRAAVTAFVDAGWTVKALGRGITATSCPDGVTPVDCDATNQAALIRACRGADVIVNTLHPPYTEWAEMVPMFTRNVLAAAKASSATVMIPGNLYVYGDTMPKVLDETTPHSAKTNKGKIRIQMEAAYARAAGDGVQTIILRGGDFIEGVDTGNWFETYVTAALHKGIVTYPGRTDICHAWAYLPDMARAMTMLADKKDQLAMFDVFGFEGLSISGTDLRRALEKQLNRSLKFKRIPWGMIRLMGVFRPLMREVMEMRYLWNVPHQVDGTKLARTLPTFQQTPMNEIFARVLKRGP